MLLTPGNTFQWQVNNFGVATPAGTSVIPGVSNVMGSWTALLAATARETYFAEVQITDNVSAGVTRDTLVDIGIDPAGGTSYVAVIPSLFASNASQVAGGIKYAFPLRIPAGATVAARAQVNNATALTLLVAIRLQGKPTRPALMAYGDRVQAVGVVAASSRGTAVVPGNGSKSAWVSLGALTYPAWWWQLGYGLDDSTMTARIHLVDIAADNNGTTPKKLIEDVLLGNSGGEAITMNLSLGQGAPVVAGATLYGRALCGGAPDNGTYSIIAYGCG